MLGASMSSLRATVILKTDLGGSTPLFRVLSAQDLTALLAAHRELVTRDFLYSRDLWVAASLERTIPPITPGDSLVYLTEHVRRDLAGTEWDARVHRVEVTTTSRYLEGLEIYRLAGA
jgi:hypothetical protein